MPGLTQELICNDGGMGGGAAWNLGGEISPRVHDLFVTFTIKGSSVQILYQFMFSGPVVSGPSDGAIHNKHPRLA
jgi:hypothetical protein